MSKSWDACHLGDAVQRETARVGLDPPPTVLSSTKHHGLVPSHDYFKGRQIFSDDLSAYRVVEPGWFAYATNHLAEGSIGMNDLSEAGCVSPMYTVFSARRHVDPKYLYLSLKSPDMLNQYHLREQAPVDRRGSIRFNSFADIPIRLPPLKEQRRIAKILDTINEAIQITERTIAKLESTRVGLRERICASFDSTDQATRLLDTVESMVDGLFGSHLKTAHYVQDAGVRLVRLANLGEGYYLKEEEAFIDEDHARLLRRHDVRSGDILVGSLGDTNHRPGRACLYPDEFAPGIVKADCFRIHPSSLVDRRFLMEMLNSTNAVSQIRRLAQGVTRDRITLTQLRQIAVSLPPLEEQQHVVQVLETFDQILDAYREQFRKLQELRSGLLDDLLSGRVRTVVAQRSGPSAGVRNSRR